MDFLTLEQKKFLDEMDRTFGDRESAKEIKQALILAKLGKINDETIEQYKRQKEYDLARLREQFNELNPDYAFKVGEELLQATKEKNLEETMDGLTIEEKFSNDNISE